MKKKIVLALLILACAAGCGKVPKLANGEEAIVSFSDSKLNISANDLYETLKDKYSLSIIIDMIDNVILLKEYPDSESEAKKYAKEQLESVKEYYVDDNGKYDEAALLEALQSYYGISTVDEFDEMLKISYYRTKATEDYAKAQITDKQIEKYYSDEIVGDISAKHILIKPDVKDGMSDDEVKTAEDAALKKAKNIIKELDAGKDFSELAKEYSQDESNASKGGELGSFNKGDMVEEFEKAAYDLKVNAYSKTPVKTKFGYHIILKTEEKEKDTLDNLKDEIRETLGKELISSEKTISIDSLVELRKSYGVNIEDSKISSKYSTYISNQLISLRNSQS